jgi:hypothetical protein
VKGHHPLEVLSDARATIVLGWVGEGVLYEQLRGSLSAELGSACASRLHALLLGTVGVRHFADALELTQCDPMARDALARVVFANSWRYTCVVVLTPGGTTMVSSAPLTQVLGTPTQTLSDQGDFEHRLRLAAPFAFMKLEHEAARNPSIRLRSSG